MSTTTTPHLGLIKPTPGTHAPVLVSELNTNADKADQATRPTFSVASYGAVGNGVADDGPAFNAALAAALAGGGGVVSVPDGTFKCTTQVVFPGDGLTIRGAGIGRTVLVDGANHTGIVASAARSNIALRDLTVKSTLSGYCVYLAGGSSRCSDITLENVFADQRRSDGSGIVVTGGAAGFDRVTLRGVRALSPQPSTGAIGIQCGAGDTGGIISYDLLVQGCTTDGFTTGFQNGTNGQWYRMRVSDSVFVNAVLHGAYFYHMGQLQIANCDFRGNDVGAYMDEDAGNQGGSVVGCRFLDNATIGCYREEWARGTMAGCVFQGNGYGLWLASGLDCTIVGCTFTHNTVDGILVDKGADITSVSGDTGSHVYSITNSVYVQDIVFSGCVIARNNHNGIQVKGVQRAFRLIGCVIAQNGQSDSPTPANYADVNLAADSDTANNYAVTITGCTIGNLGGSGTDTGYTKWGIKSASGTLTALDVQACRFEGVEIPLSVPSGALSVKSSTFVGATSVSLAAGYAWQGNTISGGTLAPPVEVSGGSVAAANNLVLTPRAPGVPNFYRITGTTQINLLSTSGWPDGSIVVLIFVSGLTVKNNQSASGVNMPIRLAGAVDYLVTSGDTLTLVWDSTDGGWYEIARAVI